MEEQELVCPNCGHNGAFDFYGFPNKTHCPMCSHIFDSPSYYDYVEDLEFYLEWMNGLGVAKRINSASKFFKKIVLIEPIRYFDIVNFEPPNWDPVVEVGSKRIAGYFNFDYFAALREAFPHATFGSLLDGYWPRMYMIRHENHWLPLLALQVSAKRYYLLAPLQPSCVRFGGVP